MAEVNGRTKDLDSLDLPEKVIDEFSQRSDTLVERTNSLFRMRIDMDQVLADCPLSVVLDNHSNHFRTISSLMRINRLDVLDALVPWVYMTYFSHGVGINYFPVIFSIYRQAVKEELSPASAEKIVPLYEWFIDNHLYFLKIYEVSVKRNINTTYPDKVKLFVNSLIDGDYERALSIVKEEVETGKDIEMIYSELFKPSLSLVGDLWQENRISVAHEHIASTLVARLMIYLYDLLVPAGRIYKGSVLVTSVLNEYHNIGAQMVADIFEKNGWKVHFLGGNVPVEDILSFLCQHHPDILALSVAISFNLDSCSDLIKAVRSNPGCSDVKIMVGGMAFSGREDLCKTVGADLYAENAEEAVQIAESSLK